MNNMLVSCIADAASLIGVPTEIAKCFLQKRQTALQNIILQEVRDGDFSNADKDDILSIVYRLLNDINDGVGKNNIRLLARLIVGLNNKQALTASKFHKFNVILADLSYEQILFLAEIVKAYNDPITGVALGKYREWFLHSGIDPRDVFSVKKAVNNTQGSAILLSLLKTGFFMPFNSEIAGLYSPYRLSALFIEFMGLVHNWEDVATWKAE